MKFSVLFVAASLSLGVTDVFAQSYPNLLADPGFEEWSGDPSSTNWATFGKTPMLCGCCKVLGDVAFNAIENHISEVEAVAAKGETERTGPNAQHHAEAPKEPIA